MVPRLQQCSSMPLTTPPSTENIFTWPVRVYWEDTDAGGIVFYANYLKFFERARTEWLRAKGVEQRQLQQDLGCIFVVSDVQLKYLRSARLDDQLLVTAHLSELGRSSFTIQQEARLVSNDAASTVLCTGSVRVGWINGQTSKPARIPAELQKALQG